MLRPNPGPKVNEASKVSIWEAGCFFWQCTKQVP